MVEDIRWLWGSVPGRVVDQSEMLAKKGSLLYVRRRRRKKGTDSGFPSHFRKCVEVDFGFWAATSCVGMEASSDGGAAVTPGGKPGGTEGTGEVGGRC